MTRDPNASDRRPWKLDAACLAEDPETFHDTAQVTAAKRVCARCPVRSNCLRFALDIAEPWGVWGGFSEGDRRRLAVGKQPRRCLRCGLDFVPYSNQKRCSDCGDTKTEPSVDDLRERVTALAGQGWSDRMIGAETGHKPTQVQYMRRKWKIRGGRMVRENRHAMQDALKPCGTPAAWRRHIRRGERVDEACAQAESRRMAAKRVRVGAL